MLRLIIFVALGYFLYRLFKNDFFRFRKEKNRQEQVDLEKKAACGEMVPDPECGAYVEIDSSISVRQGDKIYYFCSYECRDKFLEKLKNGERLPDSEK